MSQMIFYNHLAADSAGAKVQGQTLLAILWHRSFFPKPLTVQHLTSDTLILLKCNEVFQGLQQAHNTHPQSDMH